MAEPATLKKDRASVSYSHADTSWAEWLRRALEGFHIDKDQVRWETPIRAGSCAPSSVSTASPSGMLRTLFIAAVVLSSAITACKNSAHAEDFVRHSIQESDQEFVHGSGIQIDALTPVQIDSLVVLGRVWGFLKYHHPTVTSGKRHWDFGLFRILPSVIDAQDSAARNKVLFEWVEALGPVPECDSCAVREADRGLEADLSWIEDTNLLGEQLSELLVTIHKRRPQVTKQFYVKLEPGSGNAVFTKESSYGVLADKDDGYRILSLFRFWNILQYWSPYRTLTRQDWDSILPAYLPKVISADSVEAYRNVLFMLMHDVADSHTGLWSHYDLSPPPGDCTLPLRLAFVGGKLVVLGFRNEAVPAQTGLRVGDVISSIDGISVATLIEEYGPYQSGSNSVIVLRSLAYGIGRGQCAEARVDVFRGAETIKISIQRLRPDQIGDNSPVLADDRPGDTLQWLDRDVAYLKLSSFSADQLPSQMSEISNAPGLIIDIRNYPSGNAPYSLPGYFTNVPTPFAVFTVADISNPGDFVWTPPVAIDPLPEALRFKGKVAVLVDQYTQSRGEYTAMALRAAGATIVGSTTSGADGDTSGIVLPGGYRTYISGIGVFYPDRRPTQQVGIVPDIFVERTPAGIAAGRDEVIEEAIALIKAAGGGQ